MQSKRKSPTLLTFLWDLLSFEPFLDLCIFTFFGFVALVVGTSWSFPHAFMTYHRIILMNQELLTLPEHMSWPPVFSGRSS